VVDRVDDSIVTFSLTSEELAQFKSDMSSSTVTLMFQQGCRCDTAWSGDKMTASLQLAGQPLLTVDYGACSGEGVVKVDSWVAKLFQRTGLDAGT
jgi:hypothetical protein